MYGGGDLCFPAQGQLPPGSPTAAARFYLIAEMGQGWRDVFGTSLAETDPDESGPVLDLMTRQIPWRLSVLHEILKTLKTLTAAMGGDVD